MPPDAAGERRFEAPSKILLQTTIQPAEDDWSIARFSLLQALLEDFRDAEGRKVFEVVARDRGPGGAPDPVLSTLDESDFEALWLFAVDTGEGLTPEDCGGISRFRQRGGALLTARDHMDLGCSLCNLGGVGAANFFHSKNPDPDEARRRIDDPYTTDILWPNYHSGANGDVQSIIPAGSLHPVLTAPDLPEGRVRFLPSHPHEGAVGAPPNDASADVIATGTSQVTGARFNIAVAFEGSDGQGRAIAQSTFHHFADYNWDLSRGAPSFVTEPPGSGLSAAPEARSSIERYVTNVATWLVGRPLDFERDAARLDAKLDEALDESFPASNSVAIS